MEEELTCLVDLMLRKEKSQNPYVQFVVIFKAFTTFTLNRLFSNMRKVFTFPHSSPYFAFPGLFSLIAKNRHFLKTFVHGYLPVGSDEGYSDDIFCAEFGENCATGGRQAFGKGGRGYTLLR